VGVGVADAGCVVAAVLACAVAAALAAPDVPVPALAADADELVPEAVPAGEPAAVGDAGEELVAGEEVLADGEAPAGEEAAGDEVLAAGEALPDAAVLPSAVGLGVPIAARSVIADAPPVPCRARLIPVRLAAVRAADFPAAAAGELDSLAAVIVQGA
jgi:hypothetical protein